MNELHTNTDTDADKYILNGVEVTPNEFIDIVTNFLEAQRSRISNLKSRIIELEGELDREKRVSNQLYLLLVDSPKEKKLADNLIEAIRGTEEREDGRNEQRKSFPPVMGSGTGWDGKGA